MNSFKELTLKELGYKLKELRTKHNYKQEDIAKLLNISRVTYTKWELGNRMININQLAHLSQIYNISLDWFFEKTYKKITPFIISHINDKLKRLGHSIVLVLKSPWAPNFPCETVEIIVNDNWVNLYTSLELSDEFYDFLEKQLEHFGIKNIMYNNDKTIFWTIEEKNIKPQRPIGCCVKENN